MMKYGLIGERLSHSYSKELHAFLSQDEYRLTELAPNELEAFFRKKEFDAINVTIPYKQAVIPYVDELDESAKTVGAVNTVVCKNGELYGYNTDVFGLEYLIKKHLPSLSGMKVLVLGGDGGTAKAALSVAEKMHADAVFAVSRTPKKGMLSYAEAEMSDAQVVINATPVGMFPQTGQTPISLSKFANLRLVIDAIYNPLRSRLVLEARKRGVDAEGGLLMLTAQAVRARELFVGGNLPDGTIEETNRKLLQDKENLVLIGMPSCGKTTVGRELANRLGKPFFDTDEEIEKKQGRSVASLIERYGEERFRRLESETVASLCEKIRGAVIATGGGTPLYGENGFLLAENGRLIFLDRSLEKLTADASRPLSSDAKKLAELFRIRHEKYEAAADRIVKNDRGIEETVREILEER